jgi:hypothetical protein
MNISMFFNKNIGFKKLIGSIITYSFPFKLLESFDNNIDIKEFVENLQKIAQLEPDIDLN